MNAENRELHKQLALEALREDFGQAIEAEQVAVAEGKSQTGHFQGLDAGELKKSLTSQDVEMVQWFNTWAKRQPSDFSEKDFEDIQERFYKYSVEVNESNDSYRKVFSAYFRNKANLILGRAQIEVFKKRKK